MITFLSIILAGLLIIITLSIVFEGENQQPEIQKTENKNSLPHSGNPWTTTP